MVKNDTNKSDGPSCACGKEDLYEVWFKEEKNKKEQAIKMKKKEEQKTTDDSSKK